MDLSGDLTYKFENVGSTKAWSTDGRGSKLRSDAPFIFGVNHIANAFPGPNAELKSCTSLPVCNQKANQISTDTDTDADTDIQLFVHMSRIETPATQQCGSTSAWLVPVLECMLLVRGESTSLPFQECKLDQTQPIALASTTTPFPSIHPSIHLITSHHITLHCNLNA